MAWCSPCSTTCGAGPTPAYSATTIAGAHTVQRLHNTHSHQKTDVIINLWRPRRLTGPQHRTHRPLATRKHREGTESSPLFRHRGRPSAVHARIAATHQRANSPFFHIHSGSQRPHAGLMHHTTAAGIPGFSSTPGLGLTGAEPPRHGAKGQRRATRRASNLLKLAQRPRPGTCSGVSARCKRPGRTVRKRKAPRT